MKYSVKVLRDAGLQAKWTYTRTGAPIIVARKEAGSWYAVDSRMWSRAEAVGVGQAFDEHTTLGHIFSVPI